MVLEWQKRYVRNRLWVCIQYIGNSYFVIDHFEFVSWMYVLEALYEQPAVSMRQLGEYVFMRRNPKEYAKMVEYRRILKEDPPGPAAAKKMIAFNKKIGYRYNTMGDKVKTWLKSLALEGLVEIQEKEVVDASGSRAQSQITNEGRAFYEENAELAQWLVENHPTVTFPVPVNPKPVP